MNKSGTGAKRTVAHHQTIFFQQFKWEEVNSMLCKLQQFYQVQVRVFREWKTEKKNWVKPIYRLLGFFERYKYVVFTSHKNLTEYKQTTQQWKNKHWDMWKRKSSRGWEFHQPLRHIFESRCFLNVCYSVQSFIFLFSVFHALSQIFFYLLKTSLTLWSMLLAHSPTHWSCKGWRN